jgi:ATP-dependent protease ClpP protease subunit
MVTKKNNQKTSSTRTKTKTKRVTSKSKTTPKRPTGSKVSAPADANSANQGEKEKSKKKVGMTLDWDRAIHINTTIDDALLKELTPVVLKMKQESSEPITVGIDSTGGSIPAVESLIGLLEAPDQDGRYTPIYTAATNRAFSAAATLLALGEYSVAFPHSHILCHDMRYTGIEDLTPSKALRTARELERRNAALALRLAYRIRPRLIWVYIDLRDQFPDVRKRYSAFSKKFDDIFEEVLDGQQGKTVDVVGFSLALFRNLTSPIDNEIAIQPLHLLSSWVQIERIGQRLAKENANGKKSVDLIQGIDDLVTEIRSMDASNDESASTPAPQPDTGLDENAKKDIQLLIQVLARRFATDKSLNIVNDGLDIITEDFSFIKDINSEQHIYAITNLMVDHDHLFFGRSISDELKKTKNEQERNKILNPVYPQARMLWHYMVLICRCLCRGEHLLTPGDAQLLGLVDEVIGGGPVQSKREWRKTRPDYE